MNLQVISVPESCRSSVVVPGSVGVVQTGVVLCLCCARVILGSDLVGQLAVLTSLSVAACMVLIIAFARSDATEEPGLQVEAHF